MPKFPQAPSQEVMHSQWEHIPCAKEAVDKASRGWEGLTGSNRSRNKKQSLPSYCLTLEKTAPNVQKSSRKREEERSQDRAPSKPPKGAHTVAVPAFVEAAAHRAVHLLNVIFTK